MHINLAYGSDEVPIDVPDNWINGRCYRPHPIEACADARAELMAAVQDLGELGSLEDVARKKPSCAIAIDTESAFLFDEVLPSLIELLEDESDLKHEDITLILTNRPWEPFTGDIVEKLIDPDIRQRCRIVLHDFFDSGELIKLGSSSQGVPLSVNKAYMDSALKIALGGVRPDMLLGFTGGRSVLMPGLSGKSTLKKMYSYDFVASPHARYANFRNNPFHITAVETIREAGCDLAISVVPTPSGQTHRVFAGDFIQSHFQAMNHLLEAMDIPVSEPMDIVVTSGGGSGRDATLSQIVETLCAVEPVLKEDGSIVIAAALEDGLGPPGFSEIIKAGSSVKDTLEHLQASDSFVPGQWVAQRLYSILADHEVILYNTHLPEDLVWSTGITPAKDMKEAVFAAMESHGQRCKIVALPEGARGIGRIGR